VPHGLKEPENVRRLAFVDEALLVDERRPNVGIDLVPVVGPRGYHLREASGRNQVDVLKEALLCAVVPVYNHRIFRDQAHDGRVVFDTVVPQHKTRAGRRD